jgi:hypothetical protein
MVVSSVHGTRRCSRSVSGKDFEKAKALIILGL